MYLLRYCLDAASIYNVLFILRSDFHTVNLQHLFQHKQNCFNKIFTTYLRIWTHMIIYHPQNQRQYLLINCIILRPSVSVSACHPMADYFSLRESDDDDDDDIFLFNKMINSMFGGIILANCTSMLTKLPLTVIENSQRRQSKHHLVRAGSCTFQFYLFSV